MELNIQSGNSDAKTYPIRKMGCHELNKMNEPIRKMGCHENRLDYPYTLGLALQRV